MTGESLKAITEKIAIELQGSSPLGNALALAVERLVQPEPDAWLVQTEGTDVAIYLLVGSAVHEVRGSRPLNSQVDGIPPPTSTSVFSYHITRLTPDDQVSCRGTQVESSGTVKEITEEWQFDLSDRVIKFEAKPPLPAGHHRFAVALAAAIEATYAR